MKIRFDRVGPGHYKYDDYRVDRIKVECERAYWQVTNRDGRNWITNTETLRDARAAVIAELLDAAKRAARRTRRARSTD